MPSPSTAEQLLVVIDPYSCDSASSDSESDAPQSESDGDVPVQDLTREDKTEQSIDTGRQQQLDQKLLELERIRAEERRLCDRLDRVYAERQRLMILLNILQALNSRERIR